MKKYKVLLINRGNGNNLGDRAIRASLEGLLESVDCEIVFQDFTEENPKDKFLNLSPYQSKSSKSSIKQIIGSFIPSKLKWYLKNKDMFDTNIVNQEFDHVIIGGGQLINNNVQFPLAFYLWTKKFVKRNIPVSLFGVGAMDEYSLINKILYKSQLKKVDNIFVRDEYSVEALKKVFKVNSKLTYDVAFSIDQFPKYERKNVELEAKYLLGITNYKRYSKYNNDKTETEYYDYWINYIRNIYREHNTVTFFYTTIEDYEVVTQLRDSLQKSDNIDIKIANITSLDSLIDVIMEHEIIVSPRMHALILAKVYGKRVEPVKMSDKIESFVDHYLNEDYNQEEIITRLTSDLKLIVDRSKKSS